MKSRQQPRNPGPPPLLAVTVRTPKYEALSREAVKRVEKFLQIPVQVIECDDADAFKTKMHLDLLCPRTCIFLFDADWWALRSFEIGYSSESHVVMGVHDSGVFHPGAFCKPDCETLNLDKGIYLNTGLLLFNNASEQHRSIFRTARSIEHDIFAGKHPKLHDFGEQSMLNAGIQRNGVPVSVLPFSFNTMLHFVRGGVFPYIPRTVHAVHAAGVPLKYKLRHLRAAEQLFCYDPEPMQAEALAFHHALQFEIR